MSEPIIAPTFSGQEVQLGDVATMGAVGGLADDRVLAELLRMAPFVNSPTVGASKAILPYSAAGPGYQVPCVTPIVQALGTLNGSVYVQPFRMAVGPRQLPQSTPSPNPAGVWGGANNVAGYRDARSGLWVSTGTTSLGANIGPFAANSSGNTRWDLVCAAIQVDAAGPTVTRRVKDPSTGALSVQTVPQYISSPVSVQIVQGTPGSSPIPPACPADAGGVYYAPLAWVRIPSGFTTTSAIAKGDIRSTVNATGGPEAPSTTRLVNLFEPSQVRPASGNNDIDGSTQANYPWSPAAGSGRPACWLPPDMVGGQQVFALIDMQVSGAASHNVGAIVDSSCDWRNRYFSVEAQIAAGPGHAFGQDGGTYPTDPASTQTWRQMSNSFYPDGRVVSGASTVFYTQSSYCANITAGASLGVYVDPSTGFLRIWYTTGAFFPVALMAIWIRATGAYPNK